MPAVITVAEDDLVPFGPIVDLTVGVPMQLGRWLHHQGQVVPPPRKIKAVIDTGAEWCAFKKQVFWDLMLEPHDVARICTASHEESRDVYDVALTFDGHRIEGVTAIESPLTGCTVEGLIGRDVLQRALFVYDGRRNAFQLTFFP